ncbi:S8 family serine peptidase [Actinoplanes sp. GCM10030250]|uniref:S8 family peptidase n=1 Tax=Actinoplanes sp. GCM10030250 TaxID=3273376 RepID=UPI0036070EE0
MAGHRRRTALLFGLTAMLLAGAVAGAGTSVAGEPPGGTPPTGAATVLPAGRTYTVTLLTGDVVTVSTADLGCPRVTVKPAKPSGTQHRGCGPDGHVRVVPGEVAGLIGSVLDESLFDVTALILDGYDDASTAELPLIVLPDGAARSAAGKLAVDPLAAGLTERRELPVIGATSGRQPKSKGAGFLRTLSELTAHGAGLRAAGPKVWLDRRVRATGAVTAGRVPVPNLDRNLEQIKAPQAWAGDVTGRGVRVAVLDTGADFSHPDLAGRVVDRADFSVEGGDAVDRVGHGTHVAATIAGTGAASGGERRGVAPEAGLLIGKVLDDEGYGTESQAIAGMEWAAARADVVNMSLGGSDLSDGSDPLSQALDTLTAQHGTLFVVAAGNDGPTPGRISYPGAAASALTVGAVNGSDMLAPFSSRGPLLNTRAAKPELVAPGVDILAARAAGTTMGTPLDAHYTAVSGTSMATPHAAGAAALLAQKHPGWSAGRLKSALVGAADPLPRGDVHQVGAGRLNAARALTGVVAGQDLVDLGTLTHPQSGTAATPLSWSNTGTAAVTVDLAVSLLNHDGKTGPDGAATLSSGKVTLVAGGTAGVVLRVDRSTLAARPGLYTAMVTGRVGGVRVAGTPIAFYVEPPSYDVKLTMTALPGPAEGVTPRGRVQVVDINDPVAFSTDVDITPGVPATVRVPAGRYSVMGYQMEFDWSTDRSRIAMLGDTDLTITGETDLLLDVAAAKQIRGGLDGVATEAGHVAAVVQQYAGNGAFVSSGTAYAWGADAREGHAYVTAMAKPAIGRFEAYASFSLDAPGDGPSPYQYDLARTLPDGFPADPAYRWSTADQAGLARIDQSFRVLDREGSTTTHKRYGSTADHLLVLQGSSYELSGDRIDYVTPGFGYEEEVYDGATWTAEAQQQYAPGSRQGKVWVRQPQRTDWYDDPAPTDSICAPGPISRTRGVLHVELAEETDQHQRFSCRIWDNEWETQVVRKLTLHRNGQVVGEAAGSAADFAVPQQAGDYRLSHHLDAGALRPVSTRVDTAWTFRSTGPAGTNRVPVPLLSVDYALPLDVANRPADGTAAFTVRQAHGVTKQKIVSFELWTSLDDGVTWLPAPASVSRADTFAAHLPKPGSGQAVSLRVRATADGGSGIDQTIIRAYRAG